MDTAPSRIASTLAIAAALVLLPGCATTAGSAPPGSADAGYALATARPQPPAGEVIATGMVIDADGDAKLCLGGILESYPPQCVGVPLDGWSWQDLSPDDESGGVRWGAYGVQGTYDSTAFTPTRSPISLALFDPIARPALACEADLSDADIVHIQEQIAELLGFDIQLGSEPGDGCLIVDVVWDDGTLQRAADEDFGTGTVLFRSALQEVAVE